MDLTEFLLARITEDENVARAAAARIAPGLDWQFFTHGHFANDDDDAVVADLWERYDPARVLAECEAKRRIIKIHEQVPSRWGATLIPNLGTACGLCNLDCDCDRVEPFSGEVPGTCPTVLALAAVYSAHPDYQPEWAVNG